MAQSMSFDVINQRGLVLIGCGNMGSALLRGWLEHGLDVAAVTVFDPTPCDWLWRKEKCGLRLNMMPDQPPAIVVIATKPQKVGEALEQWRGETFKRTLFVSIAAGVTLSSFETLLSPEHPVVRAMPNIPVTVAEGASAYIGNKAAQLYLPLARILLSSVGEAFELEAEAQVDAVTALSGSGPAYLFQMAESMVYASEKLGLPPELALSLAKQTILGAGQLMSKSCKSPSELREAVTSPGGTTQAALDILKADENGLDTLLAHAMQAAHDRSAELG